MSEQGPSALDTICACDHSTAVHVERFYDCTRCECSGIGLPGMAIGSETAAAMAAAKARFTEDDSK
jgi:hypothetical protein